MMTMFGVQAYKLGCVKNDVSRFYHETSRLGVK